MTVEGDEDLDLDVDPGLLTDLAAGRLDRATRRLGWRAPGGPDPLLGELLHAELTFRRAGLTARDLIALTTRLDRQAPDRPALRWWARALVAERCALELDLTGMLEAPVVLGQMPEAAIVPLPVLWVRGRLRRLVGLAHLFLPTPDRAGHQRLRAAAIGDFARGGFTAEVAVTRCLSAAIEVLWMWDDAGDALIQAREARDVLAGDTADGPSGWVPLLDGLVAIIALLAGDSVTTDRSLATAAAGSSDRRFLALVRALRALHDVIARQGAPSTVDALEAALEELGRVYLLTVHHIRLFAANVLADHGQGVAAHRLGVPALDMPEVDLAHGSDRRLLEMRLRLLGERPVPLAEVTGELDQLRRSGHTARAAGQAQRLADDYARLGRTEDAQALTTWISAGERRPASEIRTESAPTGARRSAEARGPAVTVRVLAPVLEAARAGQPLPLRPTAARLLLELLLRHPRPLHSEEAADSLWPGVSPDRARPRLNLVLHRLRRTLALDSATLRRTGDLLTLDPAGWDVDLFRLRALRADTPAHERSAVLGAVTGTLCEVQFPGDDRLVDHRRAVRACIDALLTDSR